MYTLHMGYHPALFISASPILAERAYRALVKAGHGPVVIVRLDGVQLDGAGDGMVPSR